MRTTPQALRLTPDVSVYPPSGSVLVRPWSSPLPTPSRGYQGLKGFFVGLAMGGLTVGLAAAGFAEGGFTKAASPAPVSAAVVGDPPCGFDVYRGTLSVGSLGRAHGTVRVWLGNRLVRSAPIGRGQWVDFPLRRRHSNLDFTVSIVSRVTAEDGGAKVWHCDPA